MYSVRSAGSDESYALSKGRADVRASTGGDRPRPLMRVSVQELTLALMTTGIGAVLWSFVDIGRSVVAALAIFVLLAIYAGLKTRKRLPTATWSASGPVSTWSSIMYELRRNLPAFGAIAVLCVVIGYPEAGVAALLLFGGLSAGRAFVIFTWERKRRAVLVRDPSDPDSYIGLRRERQR